MIDDLSLANQAMGEAAKVVAQYAGSDASRAVVRMVDATMQTYRLRLEDAPPERVVELQKALQQLRAMRRVLTGEQGISPAI